MGNIFSAIKALVRKTNHPPVENCTVSLVRYLTAAERNGRVFVIGDVHGEFSALMSALHAVNFNFRKDLAVFVGDIHDRGINSEKCLDLLQEPWVRSTFGNHEWMMLNTVNESGSIIGDINAWALNGGTWAINATQEDLARWRHLLLSRVPLYWILERRDMASILVCHAEPESTYLVDVINLKNRQVFVHTLDGSQTIWGRSIIYSALRDKSTLRQKNDLFIDLKEILFTVHGHTQVETATWINKLLFVDTGAVYDKRLTLVDIDVAAPGLTNGIYSWDILSQKLLNNSAACLK